MNQGYIQSLEDILKYVEKENSYTEYQTSSQYLKGRLREVRKTK